MDHLQGLDRLCQHLATVNSSWTKSAATSTNQTAAPAELTTVNASAPAWLNATNETKFLMELEPYLEGVKEVTEWYIIPLIAAVGIVGNAGAMWLVYQDATVRRLSCVFHQLLLASELLYLACVIVYLQLRHFHHGDAADFRLWPMSVATILMSVFQFMGPWFLYILATDSYRALRLYQKQSKILQIVRSKRNVAPVIVVAILFHIPYVPYVKVKLHELDPEGFDPCNVPVEEHWDFLVDHSSERDLYYILYYSLAYYLLFFLFPFVCLACRDKDIIDLIHNYGEAKSEYKLRPEACHASATAAIVSLFCNVSLVCMTPKLALLLFDLFNFAVSYIFEAVVFFEFFTILANLMLVLKSALYLPVLLKYNARAKQTACEVCCRHCPRCMPRKHAHQVPIIMVEEA